MHEYHAGELAVQAKAGLGQAAARTAAVVGATIPAVAADFLAAQPMIVIGAADEQGRMWATMLTGRPGFLRVPDERTVLVDAQPPPADPLADALAKPLPVGAIAVDHRTRRRMRVNGRSNPIETGLRIAAEQVFSNCPKYISSGSPQVVARPTGEPWYGSRLTPDQQARISQASTFFIATADRHGDADASHRGGDPGFVQVLSPTLLRWPDYVGNAMFTTLGNLEVNPAAGILLPDFGTGGALQLTGSAWVAWDDKEISVVPGAQRLVYFELLYAVDIAYGASKNGPEPPI